MFLPARGRARLAPSIAATVALASAATSQTGTSSRPARGSTYYGSPRTLLFSPASSLSKAVVLMAATVAFSSSSSVAATAMAAADEVPDRLRLRPELEAYPIQDVALREIDASVAGIPVMESKESVRLEDVAKLHSGSVGSVAFVVRRPGCQLCREHGLQLAELAASDFGDKFGLWGVVKETSVDDAGLVDFVQQYFSFDVYRDEGLLLYSALGNRSIFNLTTWNPLRWYSWFRTVSSRLRAKNITGNLKGKGIIQGGILIFDKKGRLRFAYEEETGVELDADAIRAALRYLENEGGSGVGSRSEGAADPSSFSQVKEDL